MNPMQPTSSGQGPNEPEGLFAATQASADAPPDRTSTESFGCRLRAAREARGWDIAACAHALKLPLHMLRRLEHDEYQGADSKVYLASYINTYGRHLDIDPATLQLELDRIKQAEAPLIATGGISHSRFLLDRYATAATYVVLTAVIMVPMIWMGVRGTLNRDISHLAPLDAAPVAQLDMPAVPEGTIPGATSQPVAPQALAPVQEQPLLASMAAFPNLGNDTLQQPVASKPAVNTGSGKHSLSLDLTAASWVEVTDQDGTRLEYGLLPAGSSKTYHSDQPLDVRIGNVAGARVSIDGQPVGLDDFRRANVAHFNIRIQDGKATAASL